MTSISIDQLARSIFKQVKSRGGLLNYAEAWQSMVAEPVGPEAKRQFDDAWFRLVDRNLIRWSEGLPLTRAFYQLTERGRSSRFEEGVIGDPDPAIGALEVAIGQTIDPVIRQYLREAVATFQDGRLLASQFCLGAVAERAAFLLRDWIEGKTPGGAKVAKATWVSEVIGLLTKELEVLKKGRLDWEAPLGDLIDCLESCAHVYRRSRNEVGHPTEVRNVDEDELAMMITAMQRRYLVCAYRVLGLVV